MLAVSPYYTMRVGTYVIEVHTKTYISLITQAFFI